MAEPDQEPISISALQHWCYCQRQYALIHVEQVFAENVHTLRGQAVHSVVDTPRLETRAGLRIERALRSSAMKGVDLDRGAFALIAGQLSYVPPGVPGENESVASRVAAGSRS